MNVCVNASETEIAVTDFQLQSRGVAKYFSGIPSDQRGHALVQAIEVGVFCLERARTGQDLDFVRREVESLLSSVQTALEKMPEHTEKQISARIGTDEGQVLAPIHRLVNEVAKAASEKVEGIRALLQEEVDPSKETSSLGKALRTVRDLLDPQRTDSIQGSLDAAVKQVATESGPLAKAVRDVVSQTLKPLEEKITDLAKEVRGQDAAAELLAQTTYKGATYEDEVVVKLQNWSQGLGAEIQHVGPDNQPGDVVVVARELDATGTGFRIVVEAKDQQAPLGRKGISDILTSARARRAADAAIYVTRDRAGLAKEIGEFAEGDKWVACTHEHLTTAVRFLIVQERLQQLRSAAPTVDTHSIEAQILRIRTTLGKIKNIKTKATNILEATNQISEEADCLRKEVNDALGEMETALKAKPTAANGALHSNEVAHA